MRLVVRMAGVTGAPFGVALLQALRDMPEVETHLVISKWTKTTIELETPWTARRVAVPANFSYSPADQAATISSGLSRTDGMIIIPCSMKTPAGICVGYAEGLVNRAADVVLKEGCRLVPVPREMPLGTIYLKSMLALPRMGVAVVSPMSTYCNHSEAVDNITSHIATRMLDQFGPDYHRVRRWNDLCTAEQFA